MDKIIYEKATLECDAKTAFEMFTENENLQKWLTVLADVEPKVGGKYELFWNPNDKENDSTIGCKVLAIEPERFLNFEWKGPKQYKDLMSINRPLTNVTVIFNQTGDSTDVRLIHTGWGDTEQWEETRQFFVRNWKQSFENLEKLTNIELASVHNNK